MAFKILIIGGTGYIGSRIFSELSKNQLFQIKTCDKELFGNCINKQNIIKDYSELEYDYIQEFDVVILLAGNSSVKMCENNAFGTFRNNVSNFISLISKMNCKQKLIYASSSSIYGSTLKEISYESDEDLKPTNAYDFSKYEIDYYARFSDINYYSLRFGTVNGFSKNLRTDLMLNAMVKSAIERNEVQVFNPSVKRPIIGLSDLVKAVKQIIICDNKENLKGIYNLSSFNTTPLEAGKEIASIFNADLIINEEVPKGYDQFKTKSQTYDFWIDSSKFSKNFDFKFNDTITSISLELKSLINKVELSSNRTNEKR